MNTLSQVLAILAAEQPLIQYHGKQLLYLPEVLLILGFLFILATGRVSKLYRGWQALPASIKLGTALIFLGGIVGAIFAPSVTTGLGAIKSWFVFPLMAFLITLSFPRAATVIRAAFLAVAGLEILFGLLSLLTSGGLHRMAGSFTSPNFLAMLLAPLTMLTFVEWLQKPKRSFSLVLALLLFLGLLATGSVGGVLALLIGGSLLFFRLSLSKVQRKVATALLVLALIFAAVGIGVRLRGGQANSVASRLEIWHTSIVIGSGRPLTGIGIGNFEQRYNRAVVRVINRTPVQWAVSLPHNLYLAFWLYTGVLGVIGLFMLLAEVIRPEYKLAFLPFLVVLAHGLVDTPYFLMPAVYTFWLMLALSLVSSRQESKSRRTESSDAVVV